ncbi:MAG: ABC transporter permease [Candidatus Latescibacteria bacterium]|nr:ABC transporter permease [Candidatus Latescibacterota bacterium]MBT4136970.1 ABC transporter permease [Candidatus Latescibacterota bacterium]
MNAIKYILKELFAERTRVLMTILAIAWGTAAITIMLALGEGLRVTFGRSMRGIGEGVLRVRGGQTSKAFAGMPEGRNIPLTEQDLLTVKTTIPEVNLISGEYDTWRSMKYNDNWRSGRIGGVDPDFGEMRNIIPAPGGRFINPIDIKLRRRVIVMGPQVAKELFGEKTEPVGQYIDLDGRPFLVIGVMNKKYQTSSYGVPDRDGTWIPSSTYKTMYSPSRYSNWIVKPHNPEQMNQMKKHIRETLAQNHGANPTDEEIVHFWDTKEMQEISGNIFVGMQTLLGVIGGLTLIVAGVGIANVMYVSVSNATRDIGIRMAVGARDYQILTQYILEGLIATAIGGTIGLLGSQGLVSLVGLIPMEAEFFEFVGKPVPILSPIVACIVVLVLGLIGFFAGLFPARRAARVAPAEALRYE